MRTEDLLRAVAEAEADELPGLVGVLAQAQAMALARLATREPEDRTPVEDRLLTMLQVAERLGIPEENARELGRRGALPTVQLGRKVRVRPPDLEHYIALRRRPIEPGIFPTYSRGRDGSRDATDTTSPGPDPGRTRAACRDHRKLRRSAGTRGNRHLGAGGSPGSVDGEDHATSKEE
jgi:excisionase family DNA binding protein